MAAFVIALMLDGLVSWPQWLFRAIGHPVSWMGRLISALERRLNKGSAARTKAGGIITVILLTGLSAAIGWALQSWLLELEWGWIGIGILAWPFLAGRSLYDHVAAIYRAFPDLERARYAVSMIVGRKTDQMSETEISSASLESLAENASDGLIAPLFWGLVLGLPGIFAYKAINTMDSMIGHKSDRYLHFGWAAAKLDDLANLIPARLTGALFALTGGHIRAAFRAMVQDARHHRSPNAGWPESAFAASLGVKIGGPRIYGDKISPEPFMNGSGRSPMADDLRAGLAKFRLMWGFAVGFTGALTCLAAWGQF